MVHRYMEGCAVAPTRSGRGQWLAALVVTAGLLVVHVPAAFGFCRTTTCAIKKPPASCERDPDTGCWTSGIPLFWPQSCLSYAVNVAGSPRLALGYDAALAIVQTGFGHWPAASCSDGAPSVSFMSRAGLTCDRVEYNPTGPNANAIIFRDSDWPHDPTALALTTVAFNVKTGQILDADMEINTERANVIDLEFVVTHESGHFIGLDHSPLRDAVMYFQYDGPFGDGSTSLTADDVAALCAGYPASRGVPVCDFEPDKGYATDCGGDVVAACAVAPATESSPGGGRGGVGLAGALGAGAVLAHRWRARRRLRQTSQRGSRARSA